MYNTQKIYQLFLFLTLNKNLNMHVCLLPLIRIQSTSGQQQVRVFDSICILGN